MSTDDVQYSDKYNDQHYEYRHVILPLQLAKVVPRNHLMTETEWRNLGVQQSVGWVHYMMHAPEPHVLMFRLATSTETYNLSAPPSLPNSLQTLLEIMISHVRFIYILVFLIFI